ncbi:MAG: SUMF1/EgtB/PvdO family nonheme iron enzyme [Alphaproteobacteria bacterium]|nr:SUMF1/EgtB/PvdO family nonheme iron enzyme [Alphaproteobacteria bacterium]
MDRLRAEADRLDALWRAGDTAAGLRLMAMLDQLAVEQHGLRFRYIPAGTFRMGSVNGQPDERPVHAVTLEGFWLTETPVSWADFCRVISWSPPPRSVPEVAEGEKVPFEIWNTNKIRLQYCEDRTRRARNWHAHVPEQLWQKGDQTVTSRELFGEVPREDDSAWRYGGKPMVAVTWHQARELAEAMGPGFDLPTEAEWERAARGGHVDQPYPWGDAPPTPERCDFDAFGRWVIQPSRSLPPNDYGLYAMSGGVWEWCLDHYDAGFYAESPERAPLCRVEHPEAQYVLRGGSWADCAEACTVSFRMALGSVPTGAKDPWRAPKAPNVGLRMAWHG